MNKDNIEFIDDNHIATNYRDAFVNTINYKLSRKRLC